MAALGGGAEPIVPQLGNHQLGDGRSSPPRRSPAPRPPRPGSPRRWRGSRLGHAPRAGRRYHPARRRWLRSRGHGITFSPRRDSQNCRDTHKISDRLIPPAPAARSAADVASRSLPAKAFRNIPSGKSDKSLAEVIQVLDQRHPLYGRSFRVIRRSTHRGGNFPPSYEVEYRNGVSLLVPISVTDPQNSRPNQTKLSIESLRELIVAAECLECDEHRYERSLGGAATGSAASDRRRRGRSASGDLS